MKVTADTESCVAAGMCAFTAPEVFDQSQEDGVVVVLSEQPPESQHAAVRRAVRACPAQVLSLTE
ncbi:ferredoxin [Streptomyces sp. AJS327]|uniref:ferredoxin n=1 Tax=Streptomyces sp. AJS327 TaxID=2545265 RepID=UPI0015DE19AB|nr:ferredoxin [Streptomyces sp. AJS327]MBA0049947.1 ferredoxin [Streptomyces sp. AJS327]